MKTQSRYTNLFLLFVLFVLTACGRAPATRPEATMPPFTATATIAPADQAQPATDTPVPTATAVPFVLADVVMDRQEVLIRYDNGDPDTCPGLFSEDGIRLSGDYLCGGDAQPIEIRWDAENFPNLGVGMHVRLCAGEACSNSVTVTGESIATPVPLVVGGNIGQIAPEFTIQKMGGGVYSLSEALTGKRVVINYYATWCPPCESEMPELIETAHEYEDSVVFLFVDNNDPLADNHEFWSKFGALPDTSVILIDSYGIFNDLYGINYFPTTVILDENGKIVHRIIGEVWPDWHRYLE